MSKRCEICELWNHDQDGNWGTCEIEHPDYVLPLRRFDIASRSSEIIGHEMREGGQRASHRDYCCGHFVRAERRPVPRIAIDEAEIPY